MHRYLHMRIPRIPVPLLIGAIPLAFLAFVIMINFMMWWLALLVLIAWTPWCAIKFARLSDLHQGLGILFVLTSLQSVHMLEHVAQMIQIHLLGWSWQVSHGLFGGTLMDQEWMHFFFDSWLIPDLTILLLFIFRSQAGWLWLLLPIALWHCAEHGAIMQVYLKTGVVGSPGLLARGGSIGGGLPIARQDLHFLYNLAEEVLIVLAYCQLTRKMQRYVSRYLHAQKL